MMPPGSRALALASRWFDPETVDRVFEPLIADWQREWIDAPRAKRWTVYLKGIVAFYTAMLVSTPAIMRTRAPRPLTNQIAWRVAIGASVGTVILMWPFVSDSGSLWHRSVLMLAVIPQALTVVFPFALVLGVDVIRRFDGLESHTARATVSKLAVFGMVFVFFFHGWVTPAANQVYREGMIEASIRAQGDPQTIAHFERTRRQPMRGVREMSNVELLMTLARAGQGEPGTNWYATATSIQKEINNRAALALLPVILLWRRWRALDVPQGRWFSARHSTIATIAMIVAFAVLTPFGQSVQQMLRLPAGAGPWLTLAFLAMPGGIRMWLVERSATRA